MKQNLLRGLTLLFVLTLGLAACAPAYTYQDALDLCANSGVNSFDPKTGEVVCMSELAGDDEPSGSGEPTVQSEAGTGNAQLVYEASDSLDYPGLNLPDPARQPAYPNVPSGDRPALVAYEGPFEDGDFCDNTPCNVDIPQFYARVMTAGEVTIPGLDVSCVATDTKGCLVIAINHFGETAMYRGATIDHGFTIAGRVWDMSSPELVTLTGQALLDHYVSRMTTSEDGANCGVISACESVEWHVVVIGNGEVQSHWQGEYFR